MTRPFEGRFSGSSGNTACRIADLSLGGCFVQSLAAPAVGESIVVAIAMGGRTHTFHGTIVYVDAGMGFGVRFLGLSQDDLDALTRMLATLEPGPSTA